jgi:hypothetical protein
LSKPLSAHTALNSGRTFIPLLDHCCSESPRRCARTVAWLEALAGEALDSRHAAPLASTDGVWADTRRRLDAAAAARGFAGRDAGAAPPPEAADMSLLHLCETHFSLVRG